MFKLSEIKDLVKLVDQTSIHELEIEQDSSRITIRKPNKTESVIVSPATAVSAHAHAASAPQVAAQSAVPAEANAPLQTGNDVHAANLHRITSPMVGTFYAAAAPGAPAFVKVGDKVQDKTVVCIVEAMKLMNEIEAEVKGEIVDILVENGQLVEYDQPLFLVKPE